ncbi:helix-turn-helix domain-containing protein [Paraburkholderia sp. Ac-20340]|uniref:helix-turn-helix domain-containing protein n=1 Tax=Paraburkholderia sp. Ac-20340 TaxID=2703888 RepID=UPI001981BDB8|nr:helix-turn-helix domain-containing protein [Paraburkholderia sp. Ac-20340]MBN3853256.1 helix-turn-helix domain-containing protein [Paraburkholderia sp. Ac-20340]
MSLRDYGKTGNEGPTDANAVSGACTTSRIAILILEACPLSEAASVAETWQLVNDALSWTDEAAHRYDVYVLSTEKDNVACASSIRLLAENIGEHDPRLFKAIFVGGGHSTFEPEVIDWLLQAGPEVELIAISSDVEHLLNQLRPSAEPAANRSNVRNPRLVPAIERVLAMAERDFGTLVRIRSEMLRAKLPSPRGGSRTPNMRGTLALSERIEASLLWIKSNHAGSVSISELARRASMSERNFLRRFKAEVGQTPREYLARVRLENAQLLLVQTDLPVDKIARRCGLFNGDHLRRYFLKYLSVSPLEYRSLARERPMASASTEALNSGI